MSLTTFERHQCSRELLRLAAARGRKLDDEAADSALALLDDLPSADLLAALEFSARKDRYFPDVPSIRKAVSLARLEADRRGSEGLSPSVAAALASGELHCRTCEDTGWQWVAKVTGKAQREPPTGTHADYQVRPCVCRGSNPLYQAKRAREARKTARDEA